MPIYEYQCDNCGHKLEKLQKISDEPLKICPQCSNHSLKKLVSAAAFRLKGAVGMKQTSRQGIRKTSLVLKKKAAAQKN